MIWRVRFWNPRSSRINQNFEPLNTARTPSVPNFRYFAFIKYNFSFRPRESHSRLEIFDSYVFFSRPKFYFENVKFEIKAKVIIQNFFELTNHVFYVL